MNGCDSVAAREERLALERFAAEAHGREAWESLKAKLAALEQHISDLEKSLEQARGERDEALAQIAHSVRLAVLARKERDEMLAQVAESTRLAEKRLAERNATQADLDDALADNAALVVALEDARDFVAVHAAALHESENAHERRLLAAVSAALLAPHPGTALLERLTLLQRSLDDAMERQGPSVEMLERMQRLEEALRSLEWSDQQYTTEKPCCPSCGAEETAGHANDCLVGTALVAGH